MQRRLGIKCDNKASDINVTSIEPDNQRKKRRLPRRSAMVHDTFQCSKEQSNAVINPINKKRLPRRSVIINDSFQYSKEHSKANTNPINSKQTSTKKKTDKTIVHRRLGTYCKNTFTNVHEERIERNKPINKRRLQKRCALQHNSDQRSDTLSETLVDTDHKGYVLPEESESKFTGGENEHSRLTRKIKKRYVTLSPVDVIIEGRLRDGNIGLKGYVEALYADEYEEAVQRIEQDIIACAILGSIEGRGGRCLKESTSKEGMYYEVDERYAMKKVKETLKKSNTIP